VQFSVVGGGLFVGLMIFGVVFGVSVIDGFDFRICLL